MGEEFGLFYLALLMGFWFLVTYFIWLWRISSTANRILEEIKSLKSQLIQAYEINND